MNGSDYNSGYSSGYSAGKSQGYSDVKKDLLNDSLEFDGNLYKQLSKWQTVEGIARGRVQSIQQQIQQEKSRARQEITDPKTNALTYDPTYLDLLDRDVDISSQIDAYDSSKVKFWVSVAISIISAIGVGVGYAMQSTNTMLASVAFVVIALLSAVKYHNETHANFQSLRTQAQQALQG